MIPQALLILMNRITLVTFVSYPLVPLTIVCIDIFQVGIELSQKTNQNVRGGLRSMYHGKYHKTLVEADVGCGTWDCS